MISLFVIKTRTLDILDKFLAGFYVSNTEVYFQNYFTNKLIIFEAVERSSTYFIVSKTLNYKPDKTLLLVF